MILFSRCCCIPSTKDSVVGENMFARTYVKIARSLAFDISFIRVGMDQANAVGKVLQDESSLAASRTRSRLQHSLMLFKGISKSMTNICPALLTMITGRPCFDRIISLNCWRAFTLSIVSVIAANSSNASSKTLDAQPETTQGQSALSGWRC